jgi:hypothetical protein
MSIISEEQLNSIMNMYELLLQYSKETIVERDEYMFRLKEIEVSEKTLRTENAELRSQLRESESEKLNLRRREKNLTCLLEDNQIKILPP